MASHLFIMTDHIAQHRHLKIAIKCRLWGLLDSLLSDKSGLHNREDFTSKRTLPDYRYYVRYSLLIRGCSEAPLLVILELNATLWEMQC